MQRSQTKKDRNSMSEHTPGPWRTARGFSASPPIALPLLVVTGQGKECRTLAVVVPKGKESDEDLENAAIMSRAPQMLAAIKGALAISDVWMPSGDWPIEHAEEAKALYAMFGKFEDIVAQVAVDK